MELMKLEVKEVSVTSEEATRLTNELSDVLEKITGSNGKASFHAGALEDSRTAFLIAFLNGEPVGCGALQKYSEDTAEIKRVYSRIPNAGVGTQIIKKLEQLADTYHYRTIVLETRKVNTKAVAFYKKCGYVVCENYGKYSSRPEAVCFTKAIDGGN